MRPGVDQQRGDSRRSRRGIAPRLLLISILLGVVLPLIPSQGAMRSMARPSAQDDSATVPSGDVIVVLNTRSVNAAEFAAAEQVQARRVYSRVITGFAAHLTPAQAERLARHPRVKYISPDLPVTVSAQTLPTGVDRIDADTHPIAKIDGVESTIDADVAVLDTGVDPNHRDLNVVGGVDCDGANTGDYSDEHGHGTHVAGIIAARDNDVDAVGVAPGARIWAVRVLDRNGDGMISSVICGLDWVAANADLIDVVNMSLAGEGEDGSCSSTALHEAVCNVVSLGVPVVVAAGNNGRNASTYAPATYDEVITVSAFVDTDGQPRPGATEPLDCSSPGSDDIFYSGSNYGPDVDIAAPGYQISSLAVGGGLSVRTGTSMAAAHVSGAVALYASVNPGASPSQVRSWLLSSASRPQNSAVGFCGDRDSSPERVLYLGSTTIPTPTATTVPSPTPTSGAYQIVGSSRSGNSAISTYVWDGDKTTVWTTTTGVRENSAWVYVDLGSVKPIGTIRWLFGRSGLADAMRIQVSNDKSTWTTLAQPNNAPAGHWQSLPVSGVSARYVRWFFNNPQNELTLGGLAEVEILPPSSGAATPTPPATPSGAYQIVGSSRSGNSLYSTLVWDGNMNTVWQTNASSPPNSAWVYVDLGEPKPIGAIRWVFGVKGLADYWRIQVSNDKSTWTTLGVRRNRPVGQWQELVTDVTARYVRFYFTNPNLDPQIGGLAEVAIMPGPAGSSGATPAPTKTPTPIPTPQGIKHEIVGSSRSGNSAISTYVWDGDQNTVWKTTTGVAENSAWVHVDLGSVKPIGTIRWLFGQSGLADAMRIQVSSDKSTWTTLAQPNNAPAGVWQSLPVNGVSARYVRWFFNNPQSKTTIGGLAEVEVWSPAGYVPSGDSDVGTPLPTETPPATATPEVAEPAATPTAVPTEEAEPSPPETPETPVETPHGSPVAEPEEAESSPTEQEVIEEATEEPEATIDEAAEVATTEVETAEATEGPEAHRLYRVQTADGTVDPALLTDDDPETGWYAEPADPETPVWLVLNLGDVQSIGTIRWLAPDLVAGAIVRVEVAENRRDWTVVAEAVPVETGDWQEITLSLPARFVRITFLGADGAAVAAGLTEVRVLP